MIYFTCTLEFLTTAHYYVLQRNHEASGLASSPFCPVSSLTGKLPYLNTVPIALIGVLLMGFGTFVRLWSYGAFGSLFKYSTLEI
jgi:hypothetical protein